MRPLQLALIADGTSDRALLPILHWHLRRRLPRADLAPLAFATHDRQDLWGGIQRVVAEERPDILLVHRDAERDSLEVRLAQIPELAPPTRRVRVVPVRMTEAWLLLEERAIRVAAQNPNGKARLELPEVHRLESLPDPKELLYELILRASEASGPRRRRRGKRDLPYAVHVVADQIADFRPLDELPAFRAFTAELDAALAQLRDRREAR